jgi:hypothetical protein
MAEAAISMSSVSSSNAHQSLPPSERSTGSTYQKSWPDWYCAVARATAAPRRIPCPATFRSLRGCPAGGRRRCRRERSPCSRRWRLRRGGLGPATPGLKEQEVKDKIWGGKGILREEDNLHTTLESAAVS